jgi:hypothetical protein
MVERRNFELETKTQKEIIQGEKTDLAGTYKGEDCHDALRRQW